MAARPWRLGAGDCTGEITSDRRFAPPVWRLTAKRGKVRFNILWTAARTTIGVGSSRCLYFPRDRFHL